MTAPVRFYPPEERTPAFGPEIYKGQNEFRLRQLLLRQFLGGGFADTLNQIAGPPRGGYDVFGMKELNATNLLGAYTSDLNRDPEKPQIILREDVLRNKNSAASDTRVLTATEKKSDRFVAAHEQGHHYLENQQGTDSEIKTKADTLMQEIRRIRTEYGYQGKKIPDWYSREGGTEEHASQAFASAMTFLQAAAGGEEDHRVLSDLRAREEDIPGTMLFVRRLLAEKPYQGHPRRAILLGLAPPKPTLAPADMTQVFLRHVGNGAR